MSFEFWIVGVTISVVSVLGFMGNILCILMFKYKRININHTFASLLTWLTVIDSIFLVSFSLLQTLLLLYNMVIVCRLCVFLSSPCQYWANIIRYGSFLLLYQPYYQPLAWHSQVTKIITDLSTLSTSIGRWYNPFSHTKSNVWCFSIVGPQFCHSKYHIFFPEILS